MSRNLNCREENDVINMLRYAPSAESIDLDGTIVWYEWVEQHRRRYNLSYWFCDTAQQYKAAIVEGLDLSDQLPTFISSSGMLKIENSYYTYRDVASEVLEARARALTILEFLKDISSITEKRRKIVNIEKTLDNFTLGTKITSHFLALISKIFFQIP
jgi:hypothetical protein